MASTGLQAAAKALLGALRLTGLPPLCYILSMSMQFGCTPYDMSDRSTARCIANTVQQAAMLAEVAMQQNIFLAC